MPPKATKLPTTAGKAPAPTDNELISQDPDAVLAALERIIVRSARVFARPLAPAITSISIALRELQDDAPTVDQEVNLRVYMPFNADNNGASYRRVEGELRNLQTDEMERFVSLVDGVRAERGDGGGREKEAEQNRGNPKNHKGEASDLERLRKIAARIAELERKVKQRDDEREDDKKKASRSEKLQELLDRTNVDLFKANADNEELKEELMMYRRDPKKHPLALHKNGYDDEDDDVVEETVERGADDAEDDAPTFDHADDSAPTVADAKVSKKPASGAPSKKPPSTMPSYTPMPKPIQSNPKVTDQSETSKKPPSTGRKKGGKDTYKNGYESDDGPPWGINDYEPEKAGRTRRQSRQIIANNSSDQQTPEGAATGTSAAGKTTDTPSGQITTGGPGRKQSKAPIKGRKSKNDQGSEADVDFHEDCEKPVEPVSKKKRKTETSDGEEQPTTSKKPRRPTNMQPVEEESDHEDRQVHAAKGSRASSVSKAKLLQAKQNAKRKIARDDSAESEGEDED
ncbi:hypothetical protein MBLNU13_g00358t1 [Cladosporium sp. NU13]